MSFLLGITLSVTQSNVVFLCIIMLSDILLNVIFLGIIMVSVIMPSVILPNVTAPSLHRKQGIVFDVISRNMKVNNVR
jgi:hypothetical protein